jgi:hypothetical protein
MTHNGLHLRSAWDSLIVCPVMMIVRNVKLNSATNLIINGQAPNQTCNVAAAEVQSSARILQMHCWQ